MTNDIKLIGVGGYARAGKDTFVKIASKILKENGYNTDKLAFADGLKNDLDAWLIEKYGISAWTDNTEEKTLIRPLLVAHGCGKRYQTQGRYWVDKLDGLLREKALKLQPERLAKTVFFVSDVRFENEADWVHSHNGWVIHLRKYTVTEYMDVYGPEKGRTFDAAPNEEEAKNDPLLQKKSDSFLELENVTASNKNTQENIVDNTYLNREIKLCLTKCPFLNVSM